MKTYTSIARHGNKILHRFIDENGIKHNQKVTYKPTLFTRSKKPHSHKDLYSHDMQPHKFENMRAATEFVDKYKDVEDIHIGGMENYLIAFLGDEYKGQELSKPENISILTYDIETEFVRGQFPYPDQAAHRINAISVHSSNHDKYWQFGLGPNTWESDECEYRAFKDEVSLLESFVDLWREIDPDIISGWNIDVFDNLYIYNRITQVLGEAYAKSLSPWGIVNTRKFTNGFGKEATSIDFVGIASFDYLELYKKFTFKTQESYKLDHIAHIELGEKKVSYEEHGDLMTLYENDYHKFLDYSLKDTQLVKRLDDKLGLMDIGVAFSYMTKIPFDKVFGTIVPADAWIYNYCLEHKVVVPHPKHSNNTPSVMGGYVGDPKVGYIKWLLSADLTSLYPSIMRTLNLSPETKIGKRDDVTIERLLNEEIDTDGIDYTLAANGVMHSREKQGMLPFLVGGLFKERKMYKGKMLEAEAEKVKQDKDSPEYKKWEILETLFNNNQLTRKIMLNSLYGAVANAHFRYFDEEQANAITHTGQLTVKWMDKGLEEFFQKINPIDDRYCVYSDTDSVYLDVSPLVDRFMGEADTDKVVDMLAKFSADKMEPELTRIYGDLMDYLNVTERTLAADREIIGTPGIFVSKKRYAIRVYDSEGVRYPKPKMKIMGLDIVKSSTPAVLRDKLKECVNYMMDKTNDDLITYIKEVRKEFDALSIEDIGMPRGVSNVSKYYENGVPVTKGVPINSRAAIAHNMLLSENDTIAPIDDGGKIVFVYLKTPNPYQSHVMGFHDGIPEAFDSKWIDKDLQFEKAFIKPLKLMLDAIDWSHEKKVSLDSFFG